MPALRCSFCAYNYPHDLATQKCPVCDQQLALFNDLEPMEDWEEIVHNAIKDRPNSVAILQLDDPYPQWLFVRHQDLLDLGYENLEDFDVVTINGAKYELQGYLSEAECWWVEEIVEADEINKLRGDLESWDGSFSPPQDED